MYKLEIRRNILKLRRNLDKNVVENIGKKVYENLLCTKILDFNSILAYAAFDNEVRTDLFQREGQYICQDATYLMKLLMLSEF